MLVVDVLNEEGDTRTTLVQTFLGSLAQSHRQTLQKHIPIPTSNKLINIVY